MATILSNVHSLFQSVAATPVPIPYVPFSIFAILHATRIACAYRGVTRAGGYDSRIGSFQAALVPTILVLGGTTVTNVLLGIVPGWVITPLPIINYALIPLLADKLGVVSALLSLPALPRELFFCLVDGFARTVGITSFGLDTVLSHPNNAVRTSPWAMIAIASIAGGGGGMIVPAFRGFHADWSFATPPWVANGPGVDIYGATIIGYVYATLIDAHPFFRSLPSLLLPSDLLPKAYLTSEVPSPLLSSNEAKMACSLLLAGMLMMRVLNPIVRSSLTSTPKARKQGASAKLAVPSSGKSLKKKSSATNLNEKKVQ